MTITPIGAPGLSLPSAGVSPVPGADGAIFSGLLERCLQGAANSHGQASAAVQALAVGQTDKLHDVLLQVAQADLSFRLILEIRNRLTEAYQDIMKMQV